MHEGEQFSGNIFTGAAKQLFKMHLTLMSEATCIDYTFVSGMAAEKYFLVKLELVGLKINTTNI